MIKRAGWVGSTSKEGGGGGGYNSTSHVLLSNSSVVYYQVCVRVNKGSWRVIVFAAMADKEELVQRAKLAEQAER